MYGVSFWEKTQFEYMNVVTETNRVIIVCYYQSRAFKSWYQGENIPLRSLVNNYNIACSTISLDKNRQKQTKARVTWYMAGLDDNVKTGFWHPANTGFWWHVKMLEKWQCVNNRQIAIEGLSCFLHNHSFGMFAYRCVKTLTRQIRCMYTECALSPLFVFR